MAAYKFFLIIALLQYSFFQNGSARTTSTQLQLRKYSVSKAAGHRIYFEPEIESSKGIRAFLLPGILTRRGFVWPASNKWSKETTTKAPKPPSSIITNSGENIHDEDYHIRPISFTPVKPSRTPTISQPPLEHGKDCEQPTRDIKSTNIQALSTASHFNNRRKSVKKPSKCTYAVSSCCRPGSEIVNDNCFEEMECRGPFWDTSPCSFLIHKSAMNAIEKYRSLSNLTW